MYMCMYSRCQNIVYTTFQCQWTLSTRSPISLPFSEHSFLHSLYLVLLVNICVFFSNFSSLFFYCIFALVFIYYYCFLPTKKKSLHYANVLRTYFLRTFCVLGSILRSILSCVVITQLVYYIVYNVLNSDYAAY